MTSGGGTAQLPKPIVVAVRNDGQIVTLPDVTAGTAEYRYRLAVTFERTPDGGMTYNITTSGTP